MNDRRGERWRDLSWRRRIATITGQVHYKSIYAVIAVAYVSGVALVAGLGMLAIYKHVSWVRLIVRTLAATRQQPTGTPSATDTAAAHPAEVL